MNKYKVINIFNEKGVTLEEIVNSFILSFFDNELNFNENRGIINSDTILDL